MTHKVTLDAETEDAILRKASRLGLSPSDYLRRLPERAARPRKSENKAPAPQSFGDEWRAAFGHRPAGSGTANWSEVEAACDPH
jgi:hypothetical protein